MNTQTRTIPLGRAGKYGSLEVECQRFAEHVHDHIYNYGIRQLLNDAIADKTDDEGVALPVDQLVAKAQKRLDTLYSGELRTRGDAAEPVDPVEREAWNLAKAKLVEHAKSTPEWSKVPKGTKDRLMYVINVRRVARGEAESTLQERVEHVLGTMPTLRESAKRIVRERGKSADVSGIEI